jgi:hypothetical protein
MLQLLFASSVVLAPAKEAFHESDRGLCCPKRTAAFQSRTIPDQAEERRGSGFPLTYRLCYLVSWRYIKCM